MTDILSAVRSIRTSKNEEQSSASLGAIQSTKFCSANTLSGHDRTQPHESCERTPAQPLASPTSTGSWSHETLELLRSQPSAHALLATLRQLSDVDKPPGSFSLSSPGPLQSQIISTLITTIVPDFWPSLDSSEKDLLAACLRNVAAINALIARLRLLSSARPTDGAGGPSEQCGYLIDASEKVLGDENTLCAIWSHSQNAIAEPHKRDMVWKEAIALFGSGKIVATVAQVEDFYKSTSKKRDFSWVCSGAQYVTWLGKNTSCLAIRCGIQQHGTAVKDVAFLVAKALTIGYSNAFLGSMLEHLIHYDANSSKSLAQRVIHGLPLHSRRVFVEQLLRWLSSLSTSSSENPGLKPGENVTSTIASVLANLVAGDDSLRRIFESYVVDAAFTSSLSLPVRRACLAVLHTHNETDKLHTILESHIRTFSSSLFIAHAPVIHQESIAQALLIAAGYVHRDSPTSLLTIAHSSGHMQGISNRLDSSNVRARWLGMVVGTAVSGLVDKPGMKMDFGTEEMQTPDAKWYLDLVATNDSIGSSSTLRALMDRIGQPAPPRIRVPSHGGARGGKPVFGPPRPPPPRAQTKVIGEKISEILDDEPSAEDEFKPYVKPDSDPEDSDEDATLVNRNKPRAPVYIRSLMSMLRDNQNHDRFQMGLKHAAPLIRRKAEFGKEVKDHAEELTNIFCNLQDPFDTEDFDELRLQGLVAVLLSEAKVVAPRLAKQAFADGYSISQRCIILSALGLGGRELAGFRAEDATLNPSTANEDFPSKRLPPRLHTIYGAQAHVVTRNRFEEAAKAVEHGMVQPLALRAADQSTSHLQAIKVRTFSSRMEVNEERVRRKPAANELAKVFQEAFFSPLVSRYQQELAAYGTATIYHGTSAPVVLTTFVKTLAILLHASGPATKDLAGVVDAFWELLMSLRVHAVQDIGILQAVLFGLLTMLEICTSGEQHQRLVRDTLRQVVETREWACTVFEQTGSGGMVDDRTGEQNEEAKVKRLAAGVLMRCDEIGEVYRKQLSGYGL